MKNIIVALSLITTACTGGTQSTGAKTAINSALCTAQDAAQISQILSGKNPDGSLNAYQTNEAKTIALAAVGAEIVACVGAANAIAAATAAPAK